MAKLIISNIPFDLPNGSRIFEACEKAGVPFSCTAGDCGTCQIEIINGSENLSDLNSQEINLGMDKNNRLACQCTIKSGTVKITY